MSVVLRDPPQKKGRKAPAFRFFFSIINPGLRVGVGGTLGPIEKTLRSGLKMTWPPAGFALLSFSNQVSQGVRLDAFFPQSVHLLMAIAGNAGMNR